MSNIFLQDALNYAAQGWKVIPLKPGGKTPIIHNWPQKASMSESIIKKWWRDNPEANVGIVTGTASNLVVVDADCKNDKPGLVNLALVEKIVGGFETLTVETQSGGRHLYFTMSEDLKANSAGKIEGIDIRSSGGYVVAPPSVVEGRSYAWLNKVEVRALPSLAITLFKHKDVLPPLPIAQGERNDTLFNYCRNLKSKSRLTDEEFSQLIRRTGELTEPPMDSAEVESIMARAGAYVSTTTPAELTFIWASEVKTQPVSWLWEKRIARGKLSLIAGLPGKGKSQATLSMAAVISAGGAWPGNDGKADVGNVLILSAEDDASDTIVPRLEAAGADTCRIGILHSIINGPNGVRSFDLSNDLEGLERLLEKMGGAALLIIDPISAYLGSIDSHSNAEVRAVLSPLADFAAKHNLAVIGITHLNKTDSDESMSRISGSGAFVAVARCCYLIAEDPQNPERRIMAPVKNNLGVDRIGYAFKIEPRTSVQGYGTTAVVWEPDSFEIHANDLVGAKVRGESQLDLASEFLSRVLADGSVEASRVKYLAESADLAWKTVLRAKEKLAVVSAKARGDKKSWLWSLPAEPGHLGQDGQQLDILTAGTPGGSTLSAHDPEHIAY